MFSHGQGKTAQAFQGVAKDGVPKRRKVRYPQNVYANMGEYLICRVIKNKLQNIRQNDSVCAI